MMGNQGRRFRRAEERRRLKELRKSGVNPEQPGAVEDFTGYAPAPEGDSEHGRFVPLGAESGVGFPDEVGVVGSTVFPQYATVETVAGIFQVHPKTIERWRKLDGLPCLRIRGTVRYDLSDVTRWASARKEGV